MKKNARAKRGKNLYLMAPLKIFMGVLLFFLLAALIISNADLYVADVSEGGGSASFALRAYDSDGQTRADNNFYSGEIITVAATLSSNVDSSAAELTLSYDACLDFQYFTNGNIFSQYVVNNNTVSAILFPPDTYQGSGGLFGTYTFQIICDGPLSNLPISQTAGSNVTDVSANQIISSSVAATSINLLSFGCENDIDSDEVCDEDDNCPAFPNPTQTDADGDTVGDACDTCPALSNTDQIDTDNDGIGDSCDNCVNDPNSDQLDSDTDGTGDACELPDADLDTIPDGADNCPIDFNTDQADSDNDGVGNVCDNCPVDANPSQADTDINGIGDVCEAPVIEPEVIEPEVIVPEITDDPTLPPEEPEVVEPEVIAPEVVSTPPADRDNDGIPDEEDNCPDDANSNQKDGDVDGLGNACDDCLDIDADGICHYQDNCPQHANPYQSDVDGDGKGDRCDDVDDRLKPAPIEEITVTDIAAIYSNDTDRDGIENNSDNCPITPNPQQIDADGDGLGDVCDNCPAGLQDDADNDGACGSLDNCPDIINPAQTDSDSDNIGDACDACPADADNDIDGDGVCGNVDNCPDIANPDQLDLDSNGKGALCDIDESVVPVSGCTLGSFDTDGDGLVDLSEGAEGTDYLKPDTDGDGYDDGYEVFELNTDPLDSTDPNPELKFEVLTDSSIRELSTDEYLAAVHDRHPMYDLADTTQVKTQLTVVPADTKFLYIANIKQHQIFAGGKPIVKGMAPAFQDVELVARLLPDGAEEVIGGTTSNEGANFVIEPTRELVDGFYEIYVRDDLLRSHSVDIKIDSTLAIDAPEVLSLDDQSLTGAPIRDLQLIISNNQPILRGRIAEDFQVVAIWESLIFATSVVADTQLGEFELSPRGALEAGEHTVRVFAKNREGVTSDAITIPFSIGEVSAHAAASDDDMMDSSDSENYGFVLNLLFVIFAGFFASLWIKARKQLTSLKSKGASAYSTEKEGMDDVIVTGFDSDDSEK